MNDWKIGDVAITPAATASHVIRLGVPEELILPETKKFIETEKIDTSFFVLLEDDIGTTMLCDSRYLIKTDAQWSVMVECLENTIKSRLMESVIDRGSDSPSERAQWLPGLECVLTNEFIQARTTYHHIMDLFNPFSKDFGASSFLPERIFVSPQFTNFLKDKTQFTDAVQMLSVAVYYYIKKRHGADNVIHLIEDNF